MDFFFSVFLLARENPISEFATQICPNVKTLHAADIIAVTQKKTFQNATYVFKDIFVLVSTEMKVGT